MNKRRWAAVGIAFFLLIFSAITSSITKIRETKDSMSQINELLYGNGEPQEVVLESGNSNQKIAKLTIEGTILNTDSGGLFSSSGYNHEAFMKQLEVVKNDPSIQGVLLVVNTPGGAVYETAEITKELKKIEEEIPVYVSMENQAASGGYYVSANAEKIFASEDTVTGSIGVIMSNTNYSGLMEKLGITDATVKSGDLKDIGSSSRPQTEEDREVLQAYIDSSYNRFVKVVSEGRNMKEDQVRELADGRIYDGAQALEKGLIDAIGYPEDALEALKEDNDLLEAQVIEYTDGNTDFINSWLGNQLAEIQNLKPSSEQQITSIIEQVGTPQSPKAMYLYGGE
ncbi:signal peptide peptidase SppA [Enterococcus pallens]|uniref:Signal peptide peptidase SppA, 36K type n=1 Tax=Enterococcus pallens ATCC BAA-351 TaxID=1158607 RepID=R2SPE8_9ENTE|nr:signal peptide peptidase SppA [Enterococcus pallens]EOH90034.1 signal peptide peptidase SppA, 36K type [Enterococcus pallens ATCC BAA-351]EOU15360.1 signal peptide peptidase SppA, 36K type [Enterococcus pallens ATCC BAA-351]OJG76866.1 signal peptide peptidase SppA, 36K type [Enterococcus pallens]